MRAAAASEIPLISAVGHETDTTLIDFAADRRAPTPTAAAEMAVPVQSEILAQVSTTAAAGRRRRPVLEERRIQVEGLGRGLPDPRRILEEKTQRLDERAERLGLALQLSCASGAARRPSWPPACRTRASSCAWPWPASAPWLSASPGSARACLRRRGRSSPPCRGSWKRPPTRRSCSAASRWSAGPRACSPAPPRFRPVCPLISSSPTAALRPGPGRPGPFGGPEGQIGQGRGRKPAKGRKGDDKQGKLL